MFRTCLGAPGGQRVPLGSFRIAKGLPGPAPVPVVALVRLILVWPGLRRTLGTWHRPCSTGPAWRVCEVSRDWSWVDGRPARGGHPLHPARATRAPSAPNDLPSDARRSARPIRPTRPGADGRPSGRRNAPRSSAARLAATVNSALKSAWNSPPSAAGERPPVRLPSACARPSRGPPKRPLGRPNSGPESSRDRPASPAKNRLLWRTRAAGNKFQGHRRKSRIWQGGNRSAKPRRARLCRSWPPGARGPTRPRVRS
jgi:hypothetical protein